MKPLFVSFYTPTYAGEAAELIRSLGVFGLGSDVRAVPDFGSWERNCGHKPEFLAGLRVEYPGIPLVWVDADARVIRRPELFDGLTADFAAHWLGSTELLSGTLYFADTRAGNELLSAWADACRKAPGDWDQLVLQRTMHAVPGLTIEQLPPEYTWIDGGGDPDISEHHYGKREPVIVHGQASRRLRTA